MNRVMLLRVASHVGLNLPVGEGLFGVLWTLLEHVLPDMPEGQRLALIRCRCRAPCADIEQLLEVDGAIETLDKGDAQQLRKENQKHKELEVVRGEFKQNFAKKSEQVRRARPPPAKPKRQREGGPSSSAAASAPARPRLSAGELWQSDVKALLPPNCYVRQAWQHQSWHFHLRGHPRFSFPWRASDCRQAAIEGDRLATERMRRSGIVLARSTSPRCLRMRCSASRRKPKQLEISRTL